MKEPTRILRRVLRLAVSSVALPAAVGRSLRELVTDLELATRSVTRHAHFTLLTIVTLAPGLGAAAAIFGMLDQLLLRPLPGVTPLPQLLS